MLTQPLLPVPQSRACSRPSYAVLEPSPSTPGKVNCPLSHIASDPRTSNLPPAQCSDSQILPSTFPHSCDSDRSRGDRIWSLSEVLVTEKTTHQQEHTQEYNLNFAGFRAELCPSIVHLYIISTIAIHSSFLTREHGCHHFNNIRSSTLTDLHLQCP